MARAGIIFVSIFLAFLINDTYSAPNKRHSDDKDEPICDFPIEEETTDHVPWLEEGIKTGDIHPHGVIRQRSLNTELPEAASEALKDLKRASMKVATAAKKTSQMVEGGKRNDEDMVRLALEDEVEDAKSYVKKADSKMRAAMGMPSPEKARAYAMAVASISHPRTTPSSTEDRFAAADYEYEEEHDDDCEQRMSKRGKKNRYDDEEVRRKRKRSRGTKRHDDDEEHDEESLPELSEDDYKALFRSAPESSDEETFSKRASPGSEIVSVLQGAQCDLTEIVQSGMDSLLGYLSKIKPGKNNDTDSEDGNSQVTRGSEKRSENIFGIKEGDINPHLLPELGIFNPFEMLGMFLRNIDPNMIQRFMSTILEPKH